MTRGEDSRANRASQVHQLFGRGGGSHFFLFVFGSGLESLARVGSPAPLQPWAFRAALILRYVWKIRNGIVSYELRQKKTPEVFSSVRYTVVTRAHGGNPAVKEDPTVALVSNVFPVFWRRECLSSFSKNPRPPIDRSYKKKSVLLPKFLFLYCHFATSILKAWVK